MVDRLRWFGCQALGQVLRYSSVAEPVGPGQRNCSYRVSSSTNRFNQATACFAVGVLVVCGE